MWLTQLHTFFNSYECNDPLFSWSFTSYFGTSWSNSILVSKYLLAAILKMTVAMGMEVKLEIMPMTLEFGILCYLHMLSRCATYYIHTVFVIFVFHLLHAQGKVSFNQQRLHIRCCHLW